MSKNYPSNWDEIRDKLTEIHPKCANCHRSDVALEVHHIVPVSQGGSHRFSNLTPLCLDCHPAAHGDSMAPRLRWFTNGRLNQAEFDQHLLFWKELRREFGSPRYDPDEECVYIPIADRKRITDNIQITTSREEAEQPISSE